MALVNSCWHNRHLRSSHGTWSTCRNGYNESKDGNYQRPNSYLNVSTGLVALYFISRAYLNFDTVGVPTVIAAKLGLYVTALSGITGDLVITKGLWDEPVIDTDFLLQTPEVTSLGSIAQSALVLNQYNWIDLNAAGIAWINQRPTEINQHESFDWGMNNHLGFTTAPAWRSQSFTPQTTHTITAVRLRMKREGNPGTLNIKIYAAGGDHCPTGPVLASGSINANTFTTATWGDWYLIDLGAGCIVTAGTEYCIAANLPEGTVPNYVYWEGATGNIYPNGIEALSTDNGETWSPEDKDVYFIEYESAQVGGTKFCLRASYDVNDSPPGAGVSQVVHLYSAQKGIGYLPVLDLTYAVAGASASLAGKLVAAHFI